MYCDFHDEHIEEEDCYGCEEDCAKNKRASEKADEREKELERLRSSELASKIKKTLAKSLSLEDDKIDSLIIDLFDGAFKTAENQLKTCLNALANQMAVKYIEAKAKKELDVVFETALEEKMVIFTNSKDAQTTTVRKIILDKMIKFFASKDNYNNRNTIEKTIEAAIGKAVDSQVKDALDEIKKEAIEKFNKEAMKKMMMGMVGAIQNDKRLLAVLEQ